MFPTHRIHTVHVSFPKDDPGYQTHFPTIPTVPGSMILHGVRMAVQEHTGRDVERIVRAVFRRRMEPGSYTVELAVDGNTVRWHVGDGRYVYARGTMRLEGGDE